MSEHHKRLFLQIAGLAGGIFLLFLLFAGKSCVDQSGIPYIKSEQRLKSPDSELEAVLQLVDDGNPFGSNIQFYEIHIVNSDANIKLHLGKADSSVFYAPVSQKILSAPTVSWIDKDRLEIGLPDSLNPRKSDTRFKDISISYRRIPTERIPSNDDQSDPQT